MQNRALDRLVETAGMEPARPLDRALQIEVFTNMQDAADAWREAESAGVSYGFQSFAWLSTWQAVIGSDEIAPYIVRVIDAAGAFVMLLPLGIRRWYSCKVLCFLGGRTVDYNAPFLAADATRRFDASKFADLWRAVLARLPPVDIIWLTRIPLRIGEVDNPFAHLAGVRHTESSYFTALSTSFTAFQRTHSTGFWRDTRRRRRLLERTGPVSFRIASAPVEIEECMMALARQRRQQDSRPGYSGIFDKSNHHAFYMKMAMDHCRSGLIHLSSLRVADDIIATHLGMVYRNRFYILLPSHEAGSWAKYSPGRLLIEDLVIWCLTNGIKVIDFTIGDETYKRDWTDQVMPIFTLTQCQTVKALPLVLGYRLLVGAKKKISRFPRVYAAARNTYARAKRLAGRHSSASAPPQE